jgi:hypothetical protein
MKYEQYKKKPVVIEAVKFTGKNAPEISDFTNRKSCLYGNRPNMGDELFIKTLEGEMVASIGDYIIKGVQGEFYPCKPDIFEQTYEKV